MFLLGSFPPLFLVCHSYYWFSQHSSPVFQLFFLDIFRSGFWDVDQEAISDGPIRGLADRLKSTVLSAKANSTSLLY